MPLRTRCLSPRAIRGENPLQSGSRRQSMRAWCPPVHAVLGGLARSQTHRIKTIGIEHDHQTVSKFVGAVKQSSAALVKSGWIGFILGRGNGEYLANRIDKQTKAACGALEHQDVLLAVSGRQSQQLAQTDV